MSASTDPRGTGHERYCVLSIHAHPDDEASKGAPTIALYHHADVRTVLVCCTGGEEGELQNPMLREPGQPFHGLDDDASRTLMAELRPVELERSAAIIGFDEVVMLGYRDSGMPEHVANEHPQSFHQAPIDEAVGRLVGVLRAERPDVIITYGDDQRGYLHPDHIRVHDISVLAWDRAGDPAWYPEAGEPFQPKKMYYAVWSRRRMRAVHEAMLERRGESPYHEEWLEARPDLDERITTQLDIRDHISVRTESLLAHATQIDPSEPWWFGLSDDELVEVYPYEDWILARSAVGPVPPDHLERDLFDGIADVLQLQR